MTPQQKIKWLIVNWVSFNENLPAPKYPCDTIDELYDQYDEQGMIIDAKEEIRNCGSGVDTHITPPQSRHYESQSVAHQLPDKSWVGWTYWYGGGKYGEPEAMSWINEAYDLDCTETEKVVVVQEFTKKINHNEIIYSSIR